MSELRKMLDALTSEFGDAPHMLAARAELAGLESYQEEAEDRHAAMAEVLALLGETGATALDGDGAGTSFVERVKTALAAKVKRNDDIDRMNLELAQQADASFDEAKRAFISEMTEAGQRNEKLLAQLKEARAQRDEWKRQCDGASEAQADAVSKLEQASITLAQCIMAATVAPGESMVLEGEHAAVVAVREMLANVEEARAQGEADRAALARLVALVRNEGLARDLDKTAAVLNEVEARLLAVPPSQWAKVFPEGVTCPTCETVFEVQAPESGAARARLSATAASGDGAAAPGDGQ